MLLFRALNSYDLKINPVENGIVSKRMLYDLVSNYLNSTQREFMSSLSSKEKDNAIKEYIDKYINSHKQKLSKIFNKKHIPVENTINSFLKYKDDYSYCQLLKDLSTLTGHLINGSRTITNWISATSSLDGIWKYYDCQDIHGVALINIDTSGVYNEKTYVVDVSNRETIDSIKFLSNKINDDDFKYFINYMIDDSELSNYIVPLFNKYIVNPTNKKFSGFNFAACSNEFDIYQYISKEYIYHVFTALEIDLICAELYDIRHLELSFERREKELEKLKNKILHYISSENNPYMLYVFEELYLKNHNIYKICDNEEEQKKMIFTRDEIITKSKNLNSSLIKRM